jgi:uncharacterized damage-inducible protein DinB
MHNKPTRYREVVLTSLQRTRAGAETMKTIDSLVREFEHEVQTTRKHLERLPNDKLDWRPHEKSFTTSGLASHIVECVGWTVPIFNESEINFDPATYRPYVARSTSELLKTLDENVANAKEALGRATEESLEQPWSLKIMDRVQFEKPRAEVFRDFALSHVIHHRGQLSVYLRLLNVAVPGSYGPSADEARGAAS